MGQPIEDGGGSGRLAVVTNNGHLEVAAVTQPIAVAETFDGVAYNYNTGTIALTTTASENGVLYMKNTGNNPIVISTFFYLLGQQAVSGDTLVRVYANPTTGTLISAGNAQTPVNRDLRSSNTATGTFLGGADAKTVTNGTVLIESIFSGVGRQTLAVGAIILGKGNSIAITIKPAGACDAQFACSFYEQTLET